MSLRSWYEQVTKAVTSSDSNLSEVKPLTELEKARLEIERYTAANIGTATDPTGPSDIIANVANTLIGQNTLTTEQIIDLNLPVSPLRVEPIAEPIVDGVIPGKELDRYGAKPTSVRPHKEDEREDPLGASGYLKTATVTIIDSQPNILDKFDLPTYRLKLFMLPNLEKLNAFSVNEIAAMIELTKNMTKISSKNVNIDKQDERNLRELLSDQIVITSSGSTDIFTIDDLQFSTVFGEQREGNSSIMTGSMVIHAAFGHDLAYYMSNAAKKAGMHNWSMLPLFLLIDFISRDPDTQEPTIVGTKDTSSLRVFPIIFKNMTTTSDTALTTHEIEFVGFNGIIDMPVYQQISQTLNLSEKMENFKDATLQDAATYITNQMYVFAVDKSMQALGTFEGITEPDQHIIKFADEIAGSKFKFATDTQLGITFKPGDTIGKIIRRLCQFSEWFQERNKINKKVNPDNDGQEFPVDTVIAIETEVSVLSYDPARNDYVHRTTWNVYPRIVSKPQRGLSSPGDTLRQFTVLAETHHINKVYDYLYTGRNDQIQELTWKFENLNFVVGTARFNLKDQHDNLSRTAEINSAKDTMLDPKSVDASYHKFDDKGLIEFATQQAQIGNIAAITLIKNELASLAARSEEYVKAVIATDYDEEFENVNLAELDADQLAEAERRSVELMNSEIGDYRARLEQAQLDIKRTIKAGPRPELLDKSRFGAATEGARLIVDVVEDDLIEDKIKTEGSAIQKVVPAGVNLEPDLGGTSPTDETLDMVWANQNMAVRGSFTIDMTISGDLYWLPVPFSQRVLVTASGEAINHYVKDTMFMVRSGFAKKISLDAEMDDLNEEQTLSEGKMRTSLTGLYKMTTVNHMFSGGIFTQQLAGLRIPFDYVAWKQSGGTIRFLL